MFGLNVCMVVVLKLHSFPLPLRLSLTHSLTTCSYLFIRGPFVPSNT